MKKHDVNNWINFKKNLKLIIGEFKIIELIAIILSIIFIIPLLLYGYFSAVMAKMKISFSLGVAFVAPNDLKNFKRGENPYLWWGNDLENNIFDPRTGKKYSKESGEAQNILANRSLSMRFKQFVYKETGLVYYGIPFLDYEDTYRKKWNMDNPEGTTFDDALIPRNEVTDLQKINYYYGFSLREIETLGEIITKQLWFAQIEILDGAKTRYLSNPDLLSIAKRKIESVVRGLSGNKDWKEMKRITEVTLEKADVEISQIMLGLCTVINEGDDGLIFLYGAKVKNLDFAKIDFDYSDAELLKKVKEASLIKYVSDQKLDEEKNIAKGQKVINNVAVKLQKDLKNVRVDEANQMAEIEKNVLEAYAKDDNTVLVSRNKAIRETNITTFVEGNADVSKTIFIDPKNNKS